MNGAVSYTRRKLLCCASLAVLSYPVRSLADRHWDETFDVIVVGSGYAGLAAAVEAGKAGARVLVIEKMGSIGGNSVLSAGDMAVPGSPVQAALGIRGDSPAVMAADLRRAGKSIDSEHVRAVSENALDTWLWTKELGVQWVMDRIQNDWEQSYPRGIMNVSRSGFAIISALADAAARQEIEIRTRCAMTGLVGSAAAGVEGVVVREGVERGNITTGTERRLRARRGVVLAYGGFSADVAFRSSLNPLLGKNVATSNQPGATSEAWRALVAFGARMIDLNNIQVMSWNSSSERGLGQAWTFIEYVTVPGGQWFASPEGTPLLKPGMSPGDRTGELLRNSARGSRVWAVISRQGAGERHFPSEELDNLIAQGIVRSAKNLSSLSGITGIPLKSLEQAFPGSDRGDSESEGWCAIRLAAKVHHSMGGLRIDGRARVYSKSGHAIAHLFAAGEATGGLFGEARIPSHSSTDALVMGRIAGRSAAAR